MLLHETGSPPRYVCLWELNSLGGGGAPARWRGFGRCGFHLYRGFRVPLFFLPSSSSRSPPSLHNSLPSPSIALSSLLLHDRPKVLVLDSRWSGFADPPTHTPSPVPQPWARAPGFVHLFWPALSMTLETKLTMADAGWLGSSSAKRWQALSVVLPCFRATKPKSLAGAPPSVFIHFLSCGSRSQKVTVLRG